MSKRSSVSAAVTVLTLCLLPFAGCSSDGADDASEGGSGGSDAGATGEGATGGDLGGSGGGGGCAEDGEATLVVTISGLPADVPASVTLVGPGDALVVTETATLDAAAAGAYELGAARVADEDPIVRTLYEPTLTESVLCLEAGEVREIEVTYTAIPSSNRLWTVNGPGGAAPLLGFASADLAETGSPSASVAADAPAGGDVIFDPDGNLWAFGPTTADPPLVRYPASALGVSGEKEADVEIAVEDIPCLPALRAMAFDADGNLWLSTCGERVVRLPGEQLTSGDRAPDVVLSGFTSNADLAFDVEGNLWVADDGAIGRFDAARLGASDEEAADLVLRVRDAENTRGLPADFLAFDVDGDLWAVSFAANAVFEIPPGDLTGSGERELVAAVSVTLGVGALPGRPAFDEGGGLWIAYGAGSFARLSRAQLAVTTGSGDPTAPEIVISSDDVGYANNVALFPAPAGLPLRHRAP